MLQTTPCRNGYRVILEACDATSFVFEARPLRESATSLNLSSNQMECFEVLLPSNLRQLNLSSNPLTKMPTLWGAQKLLSLDLSYITSLPPLRSSDFAAITHLLQLKLQGCGLQTLCDPTSPSTSLFAMCPKLCDLCLAENELATTDVLTAGLAFLQKSLKELDLRENPVCTLANYRKSVVALLPGLQMLDNQGTNTAAGVGLEKIAGLRDHVERNYTLFDENTANEVDAALRGKKDLTVIS